MSSPQIPATAGGERPPAGQSPSLFPVLLRVLGTLLLIWTEIWLFAAAAEWALVNLLRFGPVAYFILSVFFVPAALWASWQAARLAWQAEIDERVGQPGA